MPLVDSHCHLQSEKFDADRDDVIARALETLDWLVIIGDDLESSTAAVQLTREGVYATVGVHPYHAGTVDAALIARLRDLAAHPRVVGIGEIGLDYFKYNETPRDVQKTGFTRQLELAADLKLPVVIHNRESTDDLCGILDDHGPRVNSGVIHCFAGPISFVERALTWDFYVSFAGNVTFPKAEELRTAARAVPLDRLLVETDAPYLAPQAVRGKRCEPAYVRHTADFLADFLDIDRDEFAAATAANATRLFGIGG
jgi:TatD DNase family protein